MNIKKPEELQSHHLRGAIFENWVISEYMKHYYNKGDEAPLYFWRDQKGHEIDLILDQGQYLFPIEIKSGTTFHTEWLRSIDFLNKLQSKDNLPGLCIYGGDQNFEFKNSSIKAWSNLNT